MEARLPDPFDALLYAAAAFVVAFVLSLSL